MISTNPNLPLTGGASVPASRSKSPMDPLHDECSGMANLEQYTRDDNVRADQLALMLALGMIVGAGLVWLMVVVFTK